MKTKIRKIACVIVAAVMSAGLMAGCGNENSDSGKAQKDTKTENQNIGDGEEVSGSISTNGSTSMENVISSLIEAFTEENPDVTITYDATGSGTGITAAMEGTTDIGLSSRHLKEEETGLNETVVALDGIAVIINTGNKVDDLSMEEIKGLVTGKIKNWSEVGGDDSPVTVIGREAGSGTRDGFESIVDVEDACTYDQELTSTGAVIAAVAANEYAIGYASLSAVSEEVKDITVDGTACTEDTVLDGSYKIQRPFAMITNESGKLSEAAQAFMDFATSEEAYDIISEAGAVPAGK